MYVIRHRRDPVIRGRGWAGTDARDVSGYRGDEPSPGSGDLRPQWEQKASDADGGPVADGMILSSRRCLRARDAAGAGHEVEHHLAGLHYMCRLAGSPGSGDDLSPSRRPPLALVRIRAGASGDPVALFEGRAEAEQE
jgi:hypothetical protein